MPATGEVHRDGGGDGGLADAALAHGHDQPFARGLDPDRLTTTARWEDDSNGPGKIVTVEVSYRAQSVTGLFWGGQTLLVRGQTSMIIQN
jgi:hypothetical protein